MFGFKKKSADTASEYENVAAEIQKIKDTLGEHPTPEQLAVYHYTAIALDAVDMAAQQFSQTLDYSADSIAAVEDMLSQLHDSRKAKKLDDKAAIQMSKWFGSYVGIVMVRRHGWHWKLLSDTPLDWQSMGVEKGKMTFFPLSKAYKRIKNGPDDNMESAYSTALILEKRQ